MKFKCFSIKKTFLQKLHFHNKKEKKKHSKFLFFNNKQSDQYIYKIQRSPLKFDKKIKSDVSMSN